MRPRYAHLHLVLAVAWLAVAVWLGIGTALTGNEQALLAKRRGKDLKIRTDLAYQNDRLRSAIDWASSGPVLVQSIRKLGLPLAPAGALAKAE